MKGEKLAPAPREEVVGSMGGVMQRVATYHNTRSALGYSFRYYATTMNPIAGIKLLAIDGVTPPRRPFAPAPTPTPSSSTPSPPDRRTPILKSSSTGSSPPPDRR